MPTLPQPTLLVLTDRTLLTPNWTLAQAVAPAITGGANLVLYRETDLPSTPRSSVFGFVRDGVKGRVPLIAQGDPEWAVKMGADGVHLEGGSISPAGARAVIGPDRWLGVTVVSLDELPSAAPADYALIHVDWSDPPQALEVVKRYAAASPVPLLVGPDVPGDQAAPCLLAGASGIAVIAPAMSAYDRTGSLRSYAEALGLSLYSG